MHEAYNIARENAQKAAQRNKKTFDTKVRRSLLYPGDRVLLCNMTPRGGPGKLRNHWEDHVPILVRQVGKDIPVYELRPEQGKGKTRVVDRNLLSPCDPLPLEIKTAPAKPKRDKVLNTATTQESEDEEDDEEYYFPPPNVLTHPTVPENVTTAERDCDLHTNQPTDLAPLQLEDIAGDENVSIGDEDDAKVSSVGSAHD